MSLISRVLLLALALPFVLAGGGSCGGGQFRYVLLTLSKRNVPTHVLGGVVKTAVSPMEDQRILPALLPARTVPTTGLGTMDSAAVPLTSSRPVIPLPLSAAMGGTGPTTLFVATLPRLLPTLLTHLSRLVNPETVMTITRAMARVAKTATTTTTTTTTRVTTDTTVMDTNASPPRSVNTALVTLLRVPKVSLLALFPA